MDRRELLKLALLAAVTRNTKPNRFGWVPNHRAQTPHFRAKAPAIRTGTGREVRLSKFLEKAVHKIIPHDQKIGDCVGQAYGLATDTLAATQIYLHGRAEDFKGKTSTEIAYAGSRYEIGVLVYGSRSILTGAGSNGHWCAEFLRDYGTLLRGSYDKYDLTTYNPKLSWQWGQDGVPDELEPTIKQHPIKSFSLCRNYEECRDAIVNGYPVVFASGVGFNQCRKHNRNGKDKDGFLVPCGTWYHAMAGLDVDDKSSRPSITLYQSWGPNWIASPTIKDLEPWAFRVDADVIDTMCGFGDTIAISNYVGHSSQDGLDYHLF